MKKILVPGNTTRPTRRGTPAADDSAGTAAPSRAATRVRRLRLAASAFAVLIAVGGLVSTTAHPAKAATATAPGDSTGGSAMTLSGTGEFSSLQVTVSQTQDLINQNVDVSWTGATPTYPGAGTFYRDFVQIMQCWGDDAATGPDPSQCEFGVTTASSLSGTLVISRQMTVGAAADPLETDVPPNPGINNYYMPFVPAPQSGPTTAYKRPALDTQDDSDYFDNADTNEVDYARTDADGSGNKYFQMQNNTESPGLGCGQAVTDPSAPGGTTNEPCWLVVVPRGDTDVNGDVVTGDSANSALNSSPLSATNWSHRIVFPLNFQPASTACAIGANEVQTAGDEQLAEAMSNWQTGLCSQYPNTPYSYSELSDDESRNQLNTASPGLQFVSQPLATPFGQTAPDVLYAPVAVNALTISFYIQEPLGAPDAGGQVTQLNLNARLLAKLLTQSYQDAVAENDPYTDVPKQNPVDLTTDPEFLALNPQFQGLRFGANNIPDIILPFGTADSFSELWTWINQDPAARAFLNGIPDNQGNYGNPNYSGMVVNPNYYKLQLPLEDFPTTDPYCQPPVAALSINPETPLCGIALHPYFNTMDQGAQAASQGNQGLRTTWVLSANQTGSWGSTAPEGDGSIAILALSDAATAANYDLPTASLCNDEAGETNASGQIIPAGNLATDCVSATPQAMDAAVGDAEQSTIDPSVLIPNTHTIDPRAYPLTTITYAATVPSALTADQGAQFANLLEYIAGPGQVPGLAPGDLAPGYAPLPKALAAQTVTVAGDLRTDAGVPVTSTPTSTPTTLTTAPPGQALPAFPVPTGLPTPGPLPTGPTAGVVTRETLPGVDLAGSASTAPDPLGQVRYVLLFCLLAAGLSVGAGPALLIYARRLAGGRNPRG